MKKPNITPGQWATNPDKATAADVWVEQPHGVRRFVACCPQGPKGQRQQIQDQWSEDAQAIAALPDLLEALETSLAACEATQEIMPTDEMPKAIREIRAALTKAGYTF